MLINPSSSLCLLLSMIDLTNEAGPPTAHQPAEEELEFENEEQLATVTVVEDFDVQTDILGLRPQRVDEGEDDSDHNEDNHDDDDMEDIERPIPEDDQPVPSKAPNIVSLPATGPPKEKRKREHQRNRDDGSKKRKKKKHD